MKGTDRAKLVRLKLSGYKSFGSNQDEQLEEWMEEYSMSQLWDKNILGGQP